MGNFICFPPILNTEEPKALKKMEQEDQMPEVICQEALVAQVDDLEGAEAAVRHEDFL